MRIITESRHILRDNPALRKLEEVGKKDDDYQTIINYIRAGKNFRDLPDSSEGSEIFLQRTTRVPGLDHLPTQPRDTEQLRVARASSRDCQVRSTQSQRRPEVFARGQPVLVQNNVSKLWNIKAKVLP